MANNVKSTSSTSSVRPSSIEAKQAKVRSTFATRRANLEKAFKAGKVNKAQYEEYLSLLQNKETRALYQVKRNARPEVMDARKAYNRKRYADAKEGTKRLKALGIV